MEVDTNAVIMLDKDGKKPCSINIVEQSMPVEVNIDILVSL